MTIRLFVYGTLISNAKANPWQQRLKTDAKFRGLGFFQGQLYHLGRYPGVIDGRTEKNWVLGELYELPNNGLLSYLDAYEGCSDKDEKPHEYNRMIRPIYSFENSVLEEKYGADYINVSEMVSALKAAQVNLLQINAWIYLYNWDLVNVQEINSGFWLWQ